MSIRKANSELNKKEIEAGAIELRSHPKRLIVTLTTRCNSKCIMCEVRHSSWDIPGRTLDEIRGYFQYMEGITWQGGEVFMMDGFNDIFTEAAAYEDLRQTIVTNGQMLSDAQIDRLVRSNLELTVSVDGITKDVYEKIRVGSDFDVLRKNMDKIREARKRANPKFTFKMHTVVMNSNYRYLSGFVDFAHNYGFDSIHMMPMWGSKAPEEDVSRLADGKIAVRIAAEMDRAREKAEGYGMDLMGSVPVVHSKNREKKTDSGDAVRSESVYCYLPWQQLNIDPGGEVRPGCICRESVGSVCENTLAEIWNGHRMQRYRENILNSNFDMCNSDCLKDKVPEWLRKV